MLPTAGKRLLLASLVAAAGCRSLTPSRDPPRLETPTADVVVLDNHWHTALIFRAADLPATFRQQLGPVADARYVAIGWGDEGFFRAEHITLPLIARALFYSRGSVVLVIGFDAEPEETFRPEVSIYRVPTDRDGLERTIAAALTAFRRDAGDRPIDVGPGIDAGRFFAGTGRYAFYHTCNQWTADCLAAGGLPINAAIAGTAAGVETQLRGLPGVRRDGLSLRQWRPFDRDARRLARGPHS